MYMYVRKCQYYQQAGTCMYCSLDVRQQSIIHIHQLDQCHHLKLLQSYDMYRMPLKMVYTCTCIFHN